MNTNVVQTSGNPSSIDDIELILGISAEIFRDSIQSGLIQYKGVDKFHPVTAGGSRAWEEIVSVFRKSVVDQAQGWKSIQKCGIPMLINPEQKRTIVVASGDINTGLNHGVMPKTKNSKGHVTENYISQNLDLFNDHNIEAMEPVIDSHQTWVFLYCFDKELKEVRYELSLPSGTCLSGNKGKIKISNWQQRIIFPSQLFNSIPDVVPQKEFTVDTDFFDAIRK